MQRIVVVASGRGSNMTSIADRCEAEGWQARIVAVLSDRPQAAVLDLARARGIDAQAIDARTFAGRDAFDDALAAAIDTHAPHLVVLAGYMRILGDAFVRRYEGRTLNIHPSLLPAFRGLHTHRRALQAGCRIAGATVHFVTPTLDGGPIVAQAAVPVRDGDDEAALAARVLAAEHRLYPRCVRWFVDGALRIDGQRVLQRDGAPQWMWVDDGVTPDGGGAQAEDAADATGPSSMWRASGASAAGMAVVAGDRSGAGAMPRPAAAVATAGSAGSAAVTTTAP